MKRPPRELSPRVLAYIGDAVHELHVRTTVLEALEAPVDSLQKEVVARVAAEGQARALDRLQPLLTEEEQAIVQRGCNARLPARQKAAARASTGVEALLGYLYLLGEEERLALLLQAMEAEKDE